MSRIHHHRRKGRIIAPCHDNRWSDAGVQRLLDNPNIDLNSISQAPALTLCAADIDPGVSWPARIGPNLSFVSLGADPDYDQTTPFHGALDRAVTFNEGDAYKTTSNAASLDEDDFWIEALVKKNTPAGSHYLFSTVNDTDSNKGWAIREAAADTALIGFYALGSLATTNDLAIPCQDMAFTFITIALKNGGNRYTYSNGVLSLAEAAGAYGSLATTQGFMVGAAPYGTPILNTNATIAYLSVIKRASWMSADPAAEILALQAERFALLTGSKVHKSWNGVTLPTTNSCDAATYLYKVESGVTKLHMVGKNHLKICSKAISGVGNVKFALVEGAATNACLRSLELTTGPWGTTAVAPNVDTAEVTAPDGTSAATLFDAGDNAYQIIAGGTPDAAYSPSLWLMRKDSTDDDAGIVIENPTQGDRGNWQINPSDLPDGEWAPIHRGSSYVNAVSSEFTSDDAPISGDGGIWIKSNSSTPAFYVWNPQVILDASVYPSSEITTVASAVTRPVCTLKEDITGLLSGTFSIRGSFVAPTFTPGAKHVLCHLAADASNYIQISISTSGLLEAVTAIGTGDAGAVSCAGSVCEDDKLIRFQLSGKADKLLLQYRVNNDTVSTIDIDSAVDIPLALTELSIGHDATPAYHFAPCGLCDLQISRTFSASLSEPFSGHNVLDLT